MLSFRELDVVRDDYVVRNIVESRLSGCDEGESRAFIVMLLLNSIKDQASF